MDVLIADQQLVTELFTMDEAIGVMREALLMLNAGDVVMPLRTMLAVPGGDRVMGLMPSYVGGLEAAGVKVVAAFPENFGTEYDTHQGVVLFFDTQRGMLKAIVDATSITAIRTAAVSGVATDLLARPDAGDLAIIIGAGTQAHTHLKAMNAVRRLHRVRVFSLPQGSAQEFAEREAVRGQSGTLHVASFCVEQDAATLRGRLVERRPDVRVAVLRPVLPVLSTAARRPQLFDTMTSWRQIAARDGRPLWEVAVQYEMDASGWTRERVIDFMRELARVMHRQTCAAYDEGVTVPTSPFKPDFTTGWAAHQGSGRRLSGDLVAQTVRWAYGAGAGVPGVKTVPGPMGGGGGYIYAALSAVRDCRDFTDDDLLRGLFVAGGIGAIAFTRTEPTGEVLGCGGEGGICGAMAAAAIAEMAGGTPEQVENAASLSLQATIGLPCDPIPGGGCQPCRGRLLAVTTTAHVFADLALAGHHAVLPLHEAIDVLDAVGRSLPPELLRTSRGGACATPTAERRAAAYRDWYGATRSQDRPPGNLI